MAEGTYISTYFFLVKKTFVLVYICMYTFKDKHFLNDENNYFQLVYTIITHSLMIWYV